MSTSNAVAVLEESRLPWHETIEARFLNIGVTQSAWKTLTESIWPAAQSTDSIVMALSYCQARKLDPYKRMVHIVPVWDSKANGGRGGYVEQVWPSIAEMRATAFRTGQYAGCDETQWGPTIEREFSGKDGAKLKLSFPEWAQITLWRTLHGTACKFVGPKVYWLETYAKQGKYDIPNAMWAKRVNGQLEKAAEAGALRKAFPEELGNEYAAEEMEGQRIIRADDEPVVPKHLPLPAQTIIQGQAEAAATESLTHIDEKPQPVKGRRAPPPKAKAAQEAAPALLSKVELLSTLANCKTDKAVVEFQSNNAHSIMELEDEDREDLIEQIQKARNLFGGK